MSRISPRHSYSAQPAVASHAGPADTAFARPSRSASEGGTARRSDRLADRLASDTAEPRGCGTAPSGFTVAARAAGDEVTLVVCGDIDLATATTLESRLLDAEDSLPRRIVVNLGALTFMDSTGIHVLISAQQRAQGSAHELVLTNVPAHAHRLFTLTGIDALLTIE